jgi:hypothetical protein
MSSLRDLEMGTGFPKPFVKVPYYGEDKFRIFVAHETKKINKYIYIYIYKFLWIFFFFFLMKKIIYNKYYR